MFDSIIIGSGPAGLTAAIYASRAQKNVLVIEKEAFGGMITHSPKVENYPGLGVISGLDLADKFITQAMDLGVQFDFDDIIISLKKLKVKTIFQKNNFCRITQFLRDFLFISYKRI